MIFAGSEISVRTISIIRSLTLHISHCIRGSVGLRLIIRRVRLFAKSAFSLAMSVRLSAYITTAPTGRISVKFDIGDF